MKKHRYNDNGHCVHCNTTEPIGGRGECWYPRDLRFIERVLRKENEARGLPPVTVSMDEIADAIAYQGHLNFLATLPNESAYPTIDLARYGSSESIHFDGDIARITVPDEFSPTGKVVILISASLLDSLGFYFVTHGG